MAFLWLGASTTQHLHKGGVIGDWVPDTREPSGWRHDPDAPTPGRSPAVTQIMHTARPMVVAHAAPLAALDVVDVPPRVDDWCEDRPVSELSDDDWRD